MSEKIIDFKDLRKLIRPDASLKDRRLIEMRFEEEEAAEQAEARQKAMIMGAPPLPEAQLVYNHGANTVGVAVRNGKFICQLPKGYESEGLSLAVMPGERIVAVHPNHPPLLVDPNTGKTRRL